VALDRPIREKEEDNKEKYYGNVKKINIAKRVTSSIRKVTIIAI
jgi:hypothetical protein